MGNPSLGLEAVAQNSDTFKFISLLSFHLAHAFSYRLHACVLSLIFDGNRWGFGIPINRVKGC